MTEIERVLEELAVHAPVDRADWEDVEKRAARRRRRRYRAAPDAKQVLDRVLLSSRTRLVLLAATVAVAALVALLVTSPWSSSPGFLERAQAALSSTAGGVLHMKWDVTTTFTKEGCTVTSAPQEIWTDETPPYRYRAFVDIPLPGDCEPGEAMEIGGTFDPLETLMYDPPNTLRTASMLFQLGNRTRRRNFAKCWARRVTKGT